MRALRHLSVGCAALLLLVLGGAWLLPPWLDLNRYRNDVAALAGAALGQDVRIDGPITLRLLPQPMLAAENVAVGQVAVGRVAVSGDTSVTAERLLLRVAFWPLLAGRVEARELVLRGADIRLPWPLDPAALALRTPSWLSSLSARIERGRLAIGEAAVTGLEATLATSDISGSFLSAGRAQGGGRDWMFSLRISRPGGDGAVGIEMALDGQGAAQGLGAALSAQMQPDGALLGRIAVRGPDLSQLLPAPPVPFRAEGRLSGGGGLVAADELAGDLAGSPVQGAVALRLSPQLRLDVALAASRLDLDAWLPALLKGTGSGALDRLPVGIDLSAEAAALGGGTLRGLRGAFDIADGVVTVREARATLPGDAALRLSGRVEAPGGRPRFAGAARLEAPALRTTLAWAAAAGLGPLDALPAATLRSATLAGQVVLEPGQVALSDLAGQVDGANLAASLSWRPGPLPALRAVLALETLDLDPWLPAAWPGLPSLAGSFGGLTLDLRLEAKRATWLGRPLSPLAVELAAEPGRIVLRRLEARGLGADLSVAATLLDGGRIADGRADLSAARADGLAPLLAQALGPAAERYAPLLRGALQLQLQAAGAPEALGLRLTAGISDLRLEATPTLDLAGGRWSGAVALRHPGAPRLAERLGLSGATAWLGDGSFALTMHLAVAPDRVTAEPFDLAAGSLRARGALRLDRGEVPRLSGRIAAETLPLPLPYPRSPDPLPIAALAGWEAVLELSAARVVAAQEPVLEAVTTTLSLAAGQLRLGDLAARLGGGQLTGTASFDTAARAPALSLDATLIGATVAGPVFDTPIDIAAGTLDGTLSLTAAGHSPAGLLASLSGLVSLAARDGALAGIELGRMAPRLEDSALRAALAGGSTAFDRLALDGTIDRGGLTLTRAALAGPAGTATATGTIDLARALLALRLALLPAVPDAPEIGLRLSGAIDAAERVPELAGAVRWRAEHP